MAEFKGSYLARGGVRLKPRKSQPMSIGCFSQMGGWGSEGGGGGSEGGGWRYYGLGAEKLTLQVQKNSGYVEISSIFLWSWKLPLKRLFSYDFWPFVPSFFLNFSDKTKFHHNAYFSCSGGIKFPYLKFQGFQGVHYLNFQGLKVFTT